MSPGHASSEEIYFTISQIYDNLVNEKPETGGIIGYLNISARIIRKGISDSAPFCIYETPSDFIKSGEYLRPSHADIVWSKNSDLEPEQSIVSKKNLRQLFKAHGEFVIWNNHNASKYFEFLPKTLKK